MADLVRAVIDVDLVVVRSQQGMISDGIQQGYAFHFRTAGFFLEKLNGVVTGK